jgi:hypothetical protein
MNHTLITHSPGEGKGEHEVGGWRRLDKETVVGSVPVPFEVDVKTIEQTQSFTNPVQFISAQRDQFDSVAYIYKYDPESLPREVLPFRQPVDAITCFNVYSAGTPVPDLPRRR